MRAAKSTKKSSKLERRICSEISSESMAEADELTFNKKGATIQSMKRASKILVIFAIVLFFTFGVSCAAHAAPGLALSPLMDCSQPRGPMAIAGCDHPSYLCGFDSPFISRGVLSSPPHKDFSKGAHDLSIGEVRINAIKPPIGNYTEDIFLVHGLHKISTRLFNSILNL